MKRILAAFALAILTAASAAAQKMYVTEFSGPVLIVRANGELVAPELTREKLKLWTPVAYGDVVATGTGGRIALSIPGTFSINIPESSVIGYFFEGPGTDPRPFISLAAGSAGTGSAGAGKPAGGSRGIEVRDGRLEDPATTGNEAVTVDATHSANDPRDLLDSCAAKLETLYGELEKIGAECDKSTTKLEAATDEYRTLLAAANDTADCSTDAATAYRKTALQNFRVSQLYPAEDVRSSLIAEIRCRTILARTIRSLILAPLYMTEKSKHPIPQSRDARTADFFERYAAVISRYDEVLFK